MGNGDMGKALALWLFLLVPLAIQGCASPYERTAKPTSPESLVRNVASAVNGNLFLRDDFYTDDNIRLVLGAEETKAFFNEKGVRLFGDRKESFPSYRYFLSGFSAVIPPTPVRPGVQTDLMKFIDGQGRIKQVVLRMTLASSDERLGMNNVLAIIGGNCTEDRKAENDLFMAITREPWNPPPKPFKIMACKTVDAGYERFFRLTFNDANKLGDIYVTVTEEDL